MVFRDVKTRYIFAENEGITEKSLASFEAAVDDCLAEMWSRRYVVIEVHPIQILRDSIVQQVDFSSLDKVYLEEDTSASDISVA
jgi:hypothetical protein